jgi:hypothetical protein
MSVVIAPAAIAEPQSRHEVVRKCRSPRGRYERCHIPTSGRILWDSSLANLLPGHQHTWVDYKNDNSALLFSSGDTDHLMPPKIQASNAKHYKSDKTLTEERDAA